MDYTSASIVSDVASALIEILATSRPSPQSLHRSLKRSLALLLLEIKSPPVIQALTSRERFREKFEQVIDCLNSVICEGYVKTRYDTMLEEDAARPVSRFHSLFAFLGNKSGTSTPFEEVQSSFIGPHSALHLLRALSLGMKISKLNAKEVLNDDEQALRDLDSSVKRWNSIVDQIYEGTYLNDESDLKHGEGPDPPSVQKVFQRDDSVHQLSQSLYDVLHQNWPYFCLRFATDSGYKLWDREDLATPHEFVKTHELYVEKSLCELLEEVKLTYSAKRVLGVKLARCILHLFEGPWLVNFMSIDDILVYCQVDGDQSQPLFDKIFITTKFGHDPGHGKPITYKIHPFPTILALGIILIELELGDNISDIRADPQFASKRGQPFYAARFLLKVFQQQFSLDSGLTRAVKFCVDRASFSQFDTLDSEALLYNQEFVDTYYENIVRPLEQDLVKGANWTREQVENLNAPNTTDMATCKVFKFKKYEYSTGDHIASGNRSWEWEIGPEMSHPLPNLRRASTNMSFSSQSMGLSQISYSSSSQCVERGLRSQTARTQRFFGQGTRKGRGSLPIDENPPVVPLSQNNYGLRPQSRNDFEVAIMCALKTEADAVQAMFLERWDDDGIYQYGKQDNDPNSYSTGLIGSHNVVLVHQPRMGKANAANTTAACSMSFLNIKLALIVGVCGGVPFPGTRKEILLGDVVFSKGIVQYDFGRRYPDQFRRKVTIDDQPGRPDRQISSLLARLETENHRAILQRTIATYLDELRLEEADSSSTDSPYPGAETDQLYEAQYDHKHHNEFEKCNSCRDKICDTAMKSTCEDLECDKGRLVPRLRQNQKNRPSVHFGLVASGDTVVKSGIVRDKIAKEENVIAYEMEGSGVWDTIPCVIIKGVCDYADSHKNKLWQEYAAMAAATSAKAFLRHWTSTFILLLEEISSEHVLHYDHYCVRDMVVRLAPCLLA
ncbi:hypothetical protein N7490_012018 [Penicillium lividum]|nr:hypothetical protein N7490_012018 [Penicillium lividum]